MCLCLNNWTLLQARTSDPCIYYSCGELFSSDDKDGDNQQGEEDESLAIYSLRNPKADARQSLEGLFLQYTGFVVHKSMCIDENITISLQKNK